MSAPAIKIFDFADLKITNLYEEVFNFSNKALNSFITGVENLFTLSPGKSKVTVAIPFFSVTENAFPDVLSILPFVLNNHGSTLAATDT